MNHEGEGSMSLGKSVRKEYRYNFGVLKRFIPIFAIMFIPIIYAGTYLSAFWNPYGRVDRLPVAVVNEDTGATNQGQQVHIGEDLVANLKTNHTFDWQFVSQTNANQGLNDNHYFMELKIPADFSQLMVNAATRANAVQPKLIAITNNRSNYIASLIGKNGAEQVRAQTAEQIAARYTSGLVSGVNRLELGLQNATSGSAKIASGANQLNDKTHILSSGTAQVQSGANQLASATRQASTGANEVASGTQRVYQGSQQLNQGLAQLVSGGSSLASGVNHAAAATNKLKQGMQSAATGATQISANASQLANGLQRFAATNPSLATNSQFAALVKASQQLATGTKQLAASQAQLSSASATLAQGQQRLASGIQTYLGGVQRTKLGAQALVNQEPALVNGATTLATGLQSVQSGATHLTTGANNLHAGMQQFSKGMASLAQGANQMHTQLAHASGQTHGVKQSSSQNALSNPVGLTLIQLGHVPNYGYGLAPYFISLSLFVGGVVMTIVLNVRDPAEKPSSPWTWFVTKTLLVFTIGAAQSLILDAIILKGLGIHVNSVSHFILFTLLTSFTFLTIVQFLVAALGNPGRFIAILLLVLQLTATSGTFPVILSAKFFQALHAYLPMTYTVEGFRYLIGGGNSGIMRHDIWMLLTFLIGFLALSLIYFTIRYRREEFPDGEENTPAHPAQA